MIEIHCSCGYVGSAGHLCPHLNKTDLEIAEAVEKKFEYKKAYQIVFRNLRIARRALEYLAVHQDSAIATEALEEMKNAKT